MLHDLYNKNFLYDLYEFGLHYTVSIFGFNCIIIYANTRQISMPNCFRIIQLHQNQLYNAFLKIRQKLGRVIFKLYNKKHSFAP